MLTSRWDRTVCGVGYYLRIRWIWVVAIGGVLGMAASLSDTMGSGLNPTAGWRAAAIILNAGAVWAGVAVLSGWIVRKPIFGAIAGAVGLFSAVAGYYAWGVAFGDRADVGLAGLSGVVKICGLAALFVGPLLGIIGVLIRRRERFGRLAASVVPLGVLAEVLLIRHLNSDMFAVDPTMAWSLSMLAVAALGGFVLGMRRSRQHSVPSV